MIPSGSGAPVPGTDPAQSAAQYQQQQLQQQQQQQGEGMLKNLIFESLNYSAFKFTTVSATDPQLNKDPQLFRVFLHFFKLNI